MENQIEINGEKYVKVDCKEGSRHVVVVDRGWIIEIGEDNHENH